MASSKMIQIDLLPDEQVLLLQYAYPFEPEKQQLKKLTAQDAIGTLSISPYFLEQMIGDLSYSINKRTSGPLQDQLAELCDRLEYIESTGDGTLDLL